MREEVLKAALAGLLHDVGKLGMLAGERPKVRTYSHAAVGNAFVEGHVPTKWQAALAPVGWHHGREDEGDGERKWKPVEEQELGVKLIALADRLSSGEREPHPKDTPRTKQLINIFGRIGLSERDAQQLTHFPPRKLVMEGKALFPHSAPFPKDEVNSALSQLWEGLKGEADVLKTAYEPDDADMGCYLESMFWLLRDYTWCVPSAYWRSNPDVSLFSHMHMTAALAACLAYSHFVDGTLSGEDLDGLLEGIKGEPWPREPEVAGILGGDISGIQSFIYSLHNLEGAARSLRARSFYLQVLTEAIARWILRTLGLPITNALYIGGGRFTLIVPPSAKEKLESLRQRVNEVLYRAHGISLYLGLAYVGLVPEDLRLESKGMIEKRERLARALDRDKAKRFSGLPEESLNKLFAPKGYGGEASETGAQTVQCQICGTEVLRDMTEDVDGVRFCKACDAFRDLGQKLVKAQYLFLEHVEPQDLKGTGVFTYRDVLSAFGLRMEVLFSLDEIPPGRPATLFALEDGLEPPFAPQLTVGRKFLVNLVPTVRDDEELNAIARLIPEGERVPDQKEIKHFGILARQSQGAPYLGVLRMDMDNLGKIFSKGLGKYATLSRIATLSFLVSVFFEGWVERLAQRMKEQDVNSWDRVYTVYSGGDDLFFVGSWDVVIELARAIRGDLEKFTGRKDLGISGGIALVHEKYPLYLAAEDAKGAEEAAKSLREEKDAFCFLGVALPWEDFGYREDGDTAAYWAKRLAELVAEEQLPRGLTGRIQSLYRRYLNERKKRGEMGPWIWHAAYWLSRMLERTKDEGAREVLRAFRDALSGRDFARNIARLALAARWAELLTRKGG